MQTVDAGFVTWEVTSLGLLFLRWLFANSVECPLPERWESSTAEANCDLENCDLENCDLENCDLSWMQRP
jgi:uncharacterized protein YjbI with pentapeptide repeats